MKRILLGFISLLFSLLIVLCIRDGGSPYQFSVVIYWIASVVTIIVAMSHKNKKVADQYRDGNLTLFAANKLVYCYGIYLLIGGGNVVLAAVAAIGELMETGEYINVRMETK